jgi:hypothetical protein
MVLKRFLFHRKHCLCRKGALPKRQQFSFLRLPSDGRACPRIGYFKKHCLKKYDTLTRICKGIELETRMNNNIPIPSPILIQNQSSRLRIINNTSLLNRMFPQPFPPLRRPKILLLAQILTLRPSPPESLLTIKQRVQQILPAFFGGYGEWV